MHWSAVECGLWSRETSASPEFEPCAAAYHGEMQRGLLHVVGVVRVGTVLQQAAHGGRVPTRRRQVQRTLLRVRLRLCKARPKRTRSSIVWCLLVRGSSPVWHTSSGARIILSETVSPSRKLTDSTRPACAAWCSGVMPNESLAVSRAPPLSRAPIVASARASCGSAAAALALAPGGAALASAPLTVDGNVGDASARAARCSGERKEPSRASVSAPSASICCTAGASEREGEPRAKMCRERRPAVDRLLGVHEIRSGHDQVHHGGRVAAVRRSGDLFDLGVGLRHRFREGGTSPYKNGRQSGTHGLQ